MRNALCWIVLLLAALARPAAADSFEPVRNSIRGHLAKGVPSIAVAVARDGKILWEEGFGWADRESRVEATAHTMYSLASISKPILATGLMVLRERGRIDLDRPINDYLGDAKLKLRLGKQADVTVRRVANHSSGLPLHYHFFYRDEPYRPPAMDETIRRYGNIVTMPGEKYQYSNLGYGVLDYVISRASGSSYADFMRQQVFLPLGLDRMSVGIGPGREKHHATRYGPDGQPIPFYDFDHVGASAVYASAHDLVRFAMFHLKARLPDQKPILPDRAIDEMQKPTAEQSKGVGYGIGWATNANQRYPTVSHAGGMGGVSTILTLIPSHRIAVVVLANSRTDAPGLIQREIVSALLPEQAPLRASEDQAGAGRPGPELAGAWAGAVHTYKGEVPLTLWVRESGEVEARLGNQEKTLVTGARFREGAVEGETKGDLGIEDSNRRPYVLRLSLKRRGSMLNGAVTAVSLPGRRAGDALSHWAELRKQ